MGQRRKYSSEFKLEAVRRVLEEGRGVTELARELGVRPGLLHAWKAEYLLTEEPPELAGETAEQELRRVRRELERVRQERDFLTKAVAFFAQNPE